MSSGLEQKDVPAEVPPPPGLVYPLGLLWFMVILTVMVIIATANGPFRELMSASALEDPRRNAMPIVMTAWLMMMGTIFAFQPRKRWVGYVVLTMATFVVFLKVLSTFRH